MLDKRRKNIENFNLNSAWFASDSCLEMFLFYFSFFVYMVVSHIEREFT